MKLGMHLVCGAALLALAGSARADDVASYDGDGAAAAGLSDARTRALDVAFATAVDRAVTELVTPADRTAHRGDLDRAIVGRARIFVVSFKVTTEGADGADFHVTAQIKIDRDKIRAKLGELGVPYAPVAGTVNVPLPLGPLGTVPIHVGPAEPEVVRATVLYRVTTPTATLATYGVEAADSVPGADAIADRAQRAGLVVVAAPHSGPAPRPTGDLPLDDDSARALAGDAKARVVVIVGVTLEGTGPIRGVREQGAVAVATARVLDDRRVTGTGRARIGGHGLDVATAITRAARGAAEAAAEAALTAPAQAAGPIAAPPAPAAPPLTSEAGAVLVRVRGAVAFASVRAIRDQIASEAGVDAVVIRRLAAGEVVLAVHTKHRADRIAQAIRTTPDFAGKAAIDHGVVEVSP
jgi:hypothetical protein